MKSCLAPLPPRLGRHRLPPGTVDTHCHVIGPVKTFPLAEERPYSVPDAPLEALLNVRETFGITRSVIVQPGPHGFDNRVTLDAVEKLGDGGRGVVVIPPDLSDAQLNELHVGGIRGIRLSSLLRGQAGVAGLPDFARRIAPLGWHILIHLKDASELIDLAPTIRQSPVPVILDHMARVTGAEGPESPSFRCLLELLEGTEHCWTKICSWYRLSSRPDHADMATLAAHVLGTRPDRVLWGTNWPHPMLHEPPMPDDGSLIDMFVDWVGDEAERVLVTNPLSLYGFPQASNTPVVIARS